MDTKTKAKGNLILLLTAFIWGSAFVAQSSAADVLETFTYNTCRNILGALVLLPVIYVTGRQKASMQQNCLAPDRTTLIGGICCGVLLAAASGFQQAGVALTTASKAGFITALYIVMVPIAYMFLGKKVAPAVWLSVILAIVGFYLLCVKEGFSVSRGDVLVLICAIAFTGHILVIDHFSALDTDSVKMSCIQFATAAVVSGVLMLLFEHPTWEAIIAARIPIIYAGVFSSAVAYTLQIIGQRYTDPTTATLIMSLESVFSALSGWLILHETLSPKELLGCALVFAAVLLAQIPFPMKSSTKKAD